MTGCQKHQKVTQYQLTLALEAATMYQDMQKFLAKDRLSSAQSAMNVHIDIR